MLQHFTQCISVEEQIIVIFSILKKKLVLFCTFFFFKKNWLSIVQIMTRLLSPTTRTEKKYTHSHSQTYIYSTKDRKIEQKFFLETMKWVTYTFQNIQREKNDLNFYAFRSWLWLTPLLCEFSHFISCMRFILNAVIIQSTRFQKRVINKGKKRDVITIATNRS